MVKKIEFKGKKYLRIPQKEGLICADCCFRHNKKNCIEINNTIFGCVVGRIVLEEKEIIHYIFNLINSENEIITR